MYVNEGLLYVIVVYWHTFYLQSRNAIGDFQDRLITPRLYLSAIGEKVDITTAFVHPKTYS